VTPRPPDSTGKLDSAETNPLPHVSSARAWNAIGSSEATNKLVTLPKAAKAAPVIREKVTSPRRVRADGTQEICVEDIMLIVPKAVAPRPRLPSSEALDDGDIIVEHEEPKQLFRPPPPEEFRPPAFSVHATQEVLVEDVLEVADKPLPPAPPASAAPPHREEIPSTVPPPWTIDAADDLEFPTPPQYSGPYPAAVGPRITNFSPTQVYRRRSANVKIVIGSLSLAASLVIIAGLARFAPTAGNTDGPVGIAVHAPKKLDKTVRARVLAYGNAPRVQQGETISIDSLPQSHHHR
jgi:hypothetical protein